MTYTKSIMAVSIIALMAATSAYAEDSMDRTSGTVKTESSMHIESEPGDSALTHDIKSGLKKADTAMRETADDIHAFFVDEKGNTLNPILIKHAVTTDGMIGQSILNTKGKKIAEVKDIIIDDHGNATKIIVANGGMLGVGEKLVAVDFDRAIKQTKDGKVVMNLSEKTLEKATAFSYDRNEAPSAEVLSAKSISASALVDGNVYGSDGKKMASIENLSVENADAERLIVRFDQTLGLGGELAALDYNSLNVMKEKNGSVKVALTAAQTKQFSNFKAMTKTQ